MEASVARCLRTPPDLSRGQELNASNSRKLTLREQTLENCCHLQLFNFEPLTGLTRAKANIIGRPSILFRPHQQRSLRARAQSVGGGAAGYCPRVRTGKSAAFIAIVCKQTGKI